MANPNPPGQWAKGQSGNPAGRPKGMTLTSRLRELLEKEQPSGKTTADFFAQRILVEALKPDGDFRAVQLVYDRIDGRATDKLEVKTTEGGSSSSCDLWIEKMRLKALGNPVAREAFLTVSKFTLDLREKHPGISNREINQLALQDEAVREATCTYDEFIGAPENQDDSPTFSAFGNLPTPEQSPKFTDG